MIGERVQMSDGLCGVVTNLGDGIIWILRDGERFEHPYSPGQSGFAGNEKRCGKPCQGVVFIRRVAGPMPSATPKIGSCQRFGAPQESIMVV